MTGSRILRGRLVLALAMPQPNRAGAATVGAYLGELLRTLWRQGSRFDGKRPFLQSDWQFDLYYPLVQAGLVDGQIDPENEWLEQVDERAGHQLIAEAIEALLAAGLPAAAPHTEGER